mmetsp:Transcript_18161/g.23789  ORF Transcript_18161/g.23789 Transcript_18161/m.23789 type:complete len:80 (+) Transcript_18161:73-312(+)
MTGEESFWGQYYGPAAKGLEGPCLYRFTSAVIAGAGVGTFMGACQVAWYPDPVVNETKKDGRCSDCQIIRFRNCPSWYD